MVQNWNGNKNWNKLFSIDLEIRIEIAYIPIDVFILYMNQNRFLQATKVSLVNYHHHHHLLLLLFY